VPAKKLSRRAYRSGQTRPCCNGPPRNPATRVEALAQRGFQTDPLPKGKGARQIPRTTGGAAGAWRASITWRRSTASRTWAFTNRVRAMIEEQRHHPELHLAGGPLSASRSRHTGSAPSPRATSPSPPRPTGSSRGRRRTTTAGRAQANAPARRPHTPVQARTSGHASSALLRELNLRSCGVPFSDSMPALRALRRLTPQQTAQEPPM